MPPPPPGIAGTINLPAASSSWNWSGLWDTAKSVGGTILDLWGADRAADRQLKIAKANAEQQTRLFALQLAAGKDASGGPITNPAAPTFMLRPPDYQSGPRVNSAPPPSVITIPGTSTQIPIAYLAGGAALLVVLLAWGKS